jgi:hypothetical protein
VLAKNRADRDRFERADQGWHALRLHDLRLTGAAARWLTSGVSLAIVSRLRPDLDKRPA